MFGRLIVNMFEEYDLMSPSQSGFKPRNFCTNQLLLFTHDIYKFFDDADLKVESPFFIY